VKGRRFTIYVPEDLVPEVRRCLDNGRAMQELLFEVAPRYVRALKEQRAKPLKKAVGWNLPSTAKRQISFADWEMVHQGVRLEPMLQAISDFLDDNATIIDAIQRDLQRGLKNPMQSDSASTGSTTGRGRRVAACKKSSA
jgi:hypothetical protein